MSLRGFSLRRPGRNTTAPRDDRPFSRAAPRPAPAWAGLACTARPATSDTGSDGEEGGVRSFSHYFEPGVEPGLGACQGAGQGAEPLYSEPDLGGWPGRETSLFCSPASPGLCFLTASQGRYHVREPSTDSDYESYSLERGEQGETMPGRARPGQARTVVGG